MLLPLTGDHPPTHSSFRGPVAHSPTHILSSYPVDQQNPLPPCRSLALLIRGCLDEGPNVKVATSVNMFLSSTFDDTSAERNYFMDCCYPILQQYCQSLGLFFQVVDLRWGVRDDATDNHMTIDICLGELGRCMQQSTAVRFTSLKNTKPYPTLPYLLSSLIHLLRHLLYHFPTNTEGEFCLSVNGAVRLARIAQPCEGERVRDGRR